MERLCSTCHFWASYGIDNEKPLRGECSMPMEHETRVLIFPTLRKKDSNEPFRWIAKDDPDFPSDVDISFAVVTPHNFHCDAWQEIVYEDESEEDTEGEEWKDA